jgi:hypothetical protein
VSESESVVALHSSEETASTTSEYVLPQIERATEREGLPRSYRMRADAHYVDQLESAAPPVIRLLACAHIECTDLPHADHLEPLVRSIRTHGVLQPLLIRRHAGRYTLMAGRRRLAAAMAAGLASVPCVLHDIDASAVAGVAEAENLRADERHTNEAERQAAHVVLQSLAADLSTIRTSLSLLKGRHQRGLAQRVAGDLIEAQTVRAEWMVSCLSGGFENSRRSSVAALVQHVSDAFAAQTTLTGLQLECHVTSAASTWKLPEDAATAVIKGAVFATLALVDGAAAPTIELHADSTLRGALKVEAIQRMSPLPAHAEQDPIVALALRTARGVVAQYGGSADLTALPSAGSRLQITFAA